LDVGKNNLELFPSSEVASLSNLQIFNICHNPKIADKIEALHFTPSLTELYLRGLRLDFFLEGRGKVDQLLAATRLKLLVSSSKSQPSLSTQQRTLSSSQKPASAQQSAEKIALSRAYYPSPLIPTLTFLGRFYLCYRQSRTSTR